MQMSLDDHIQELYTGIATNKDCTELCKTLGLLRAALHVQVENLNTRVADIILATPFQNASSTLADLNPSDSQRKPPTGDYSAA
jgi:hypothetical protein